MVAARSAAIGVSYGANGTEVLNKEVDTWDNIGEKVLESLKVITHT
ncbi:hypothetical protein ABIE66_001866 [Peribacillus sp. B2I2]